MRGRRPLGGPPITRPAPACARGGPLREGCSSARNLDDRGAVAAEFAVTLPAVIVVLALGIGMLGAATTTVRLQHAVTEAARLLGRGDDARASASVSAVGGEMTVTRGDGLVCASATALPPITLPVALPPAQARACALDGGR